MKALKKYLIKDLPKGTVVITKEQLLEIPKGGGTTGDLTLEQARQNGNILEGEVEYLDYSQWIMKVNSALSSEYRSGVRADDGNLFFITEHIPTGRHKGFVLGGDSLTNMDIQSELQSINLNDASRDIKISALSDGKGLFGAFEYNKQGYRKAFAQLSDVYDSISYSTDEIKTGGTWIDGKPIYSKYITISLPSGSASAISFAYPTFKIIDFEKCFLTLPSGTRKTPPGTNAGFENDWFFSIENDSSILVKPDVSSAQVRTISGVLIYTKTTD